MFIGRKTQGCQAPNFWILSRKRVPGTDTSGVIWGYPANGKENYANGPTLYYAWHSGYYHVWRERTLGEYDSISTAWWKDGNVNLDLESGWEYTKSGLYSP
jgi:hypothetical protein